MCFVVVNNMYDFCLHVVFVEVFGSHMMRNEADAPDTLLSGTSRSMRGVQTRLWVGGVRISCCVSYKCYFGPWGRQCGNGGRDEE